MADGERDDAATVSEDAEVEVTEPGGGEAEAEATDAEVSEAESTEGESGEAEEAEEAEEVADAEEVEDEDDALLDEEQPDQPGPTPDPTGRFGPVPAAEA